jgi:hypothetical protein
MVGSEYLNHRDSLDGGENQRNGDGCDRKSRCLNKIIELLRRHVQLGGIEPLALPQSQNVPHERTGVTATVHHISKP